MHPAFRPLLQRVRSLGNPARKYLRTVEQHGGRLLERLEATGDLSHIHLDRVAPGLQEDFARVAAAGRDRDEQLLLLGTFYAVQLLHQNARSLEQLAFDLAERSDRLGSYAAFLEHTGEEFTLLVSTYARHVLECAAEPGVDPFVVLNVGTPAHQDDLDAAVIVADEADRGPINRTIARLSAQCLRFASPLDHYLAEELEAEGFSMSVAELGRGLRSGRLGAVAVTELLRAEPLAGEIGILRRLREEVMAEYFFRAGGDNTRHELCLRGLLGEARSLRLRPPPPDRVDPKDDGLRLILGLATAFKTIEGLAATQPGEILARLMSRRPELRALFVRLDRSRIFLETFRQTAQLIVAEEEEIAVQGDGARDNLDAIAAALGYRDWGPVGAVERLLVHYHEAVEEANAAAVDLMGEVARHLARISRFSRWTHGAPPDDLAAELARAFADASSAFHGVRFYDDVLEAFAAPGGARLAAFARSFARLPPEPRAEIASLYAAFGIDAPYTLLGLVTLLAGHQGRCDGVDTVDELAGSFVCRLARPESAEAVRALSRVFRSYPQLVNRFLFALKPARLERLQTAVEVPIGNPEVALARDAFRALIRVHLECSRYIKRVLARVTERHPATVQALSDDALLRTLAQGRLATSERHPSPETQKQLLGDFYDVEFLRIAMGTLGGEANASTRAAFAELTTTYLARLSGFCFRQVEQETGGWTFERDRLGIFLSGGHARGRPYDEDYDLLVLLDSADPAARVFAERVVVVMNGEIARRGVISQYRLGEWLERFVVTLDELQELLARDEDGLFVDRCQLLGSRMIVGSRRIEEQVRQRILVPQLFARAEPFQSRVRRELRERRSAWTPLPGGRVQIKEDPGGLREIDLSLAAAKARFALWDTPGEDPFDVLARLDPERAAAYVSLRDANHFLVAVRSAYRVAVAATDEIEREGLAGPARLLGDPDGDGERLFDSIERTLKESAARVDGLAGLSQT